jgi:hypothetical protein
MTQKDNAQSQENPDLQNKNRYIISLAKELIDDIELSRLHGEALLLKTLRLARLTGPLETRTWIGYELMGYNNSGDDEIFMKYMGIMGRWTDYKTKMGYWFPLAQADAYISSYQLSLQSLRVPDISYAPANPNNWAGSDKITMSAPLNTVIKEGRALQIAIAQLSGIKSRVIAHIYNFVMDIYHEKIFSGLAEGIFERYKTKVDALLSERAGESLKKIPAINNSLVEGNKEAISHAQTSCRRMIDAFADAVYPPTEEVIEVDNKPVTLNKAAVRARINQYISQKTKSKSRQDKLRQTLSNLYSRVSTGVHDDVTLEEAQSLFLQTYLFLGEVLTLGQPPTPTPVNDSPSPSEIPTE